MYSLYVSGRRVAVSNDIGHLEAFLELYLGDDWHNKTFHIKWEEEILTDDVRNVKKVKIEKIEKVLEKRGDYFNAGSKMGC